VVASQGAGKLEEGKGKKEIRIALFYSFVLKFTNTEMTIK
jgi:hypothetical protein